MGWKGVVLKLRCWLRTRGNRYRVKGCDNNFIIKHSTLKSCTFDVIGENNTVVLDEGVTAKHVTFYIRGCGSRIEIGKGCYLGEGSRLHIEDSNSMLTIGDRTTVGEALVAVTEPFSKINIGSDGMISHDVEIRTGDSHSILDVKTGKRINEAKHVWVGNHVWIGAYAKVLKGVTIQNDSIVGLGAVVTKDVPENSVVAGNPAKLVKQGVTWSRERLYEQ